MRKQLLQPKKRLPAIIAGGHILQFSGARDCLENAETGRFSPAPLNLLKQEKFPPAPKPEGGNKNTQAAENVQQGQKEEIC